MSRYPFPYYASTHERQDCKKQHKTNAKSITDYVNEISISCGKVFHRADRM